MLLHSLHLMLLMRRQMKLRLLLMMLLLRLLELHSPLLFVVPLCL